MYLYRGMVFEEWGNKGLLEMHGEGICRLGKIYYGCYNRKNSCRNLFEEKGGDRVKVTLFIMRG